MTALAVIGANYGDEGKGLVTDYLCAKHGVATVVRFNGGAQAGHTVVTPDGRRHVFHHFGAGTFAGAETFLSRFFVCNPALFRQEAAALPHAVVFADPSCLVTTPFDMLMNQVVEEDRGSKRHGSCGVGFNETIERCKYERYALRVSDLRSEITLLRLLDRILTEYVPFRLGQLGLGFDIYHRFLDVAPAYATHFALDCDKFMNSVGMYVMPVRGPILFEGAQGLLLSQDNQADFPHVTRSYTGVRNAVELCQEWGVAALDAVYVTRTYLTRHGAGPLPNELEGPPSEAFRDDTNVPHAFQGSLRFAPLNVDELVQRVCRDAQSASGVSVGPSIALTCIDHGGDDIAENPNFSYRSYGPTRAHFREKEHSFDHPI